MEPTMTDVAVQPAPDVVLNKIPEVMRMLRMLRMSRGALYQEMSAGRLRRVKRGRSVCDCGGHRGLRGAAGAGNRGCGQVSGKPRGSGLRKPNLRSSIFQGGDGKWQGYVTMGNRSDGKPDRRHRTGATEAEVTAKVRELEGKRDA